MKILFDDGRWFDSTKDGVVLVLSDTDKKNIAGMSSDCHAYCSCPVNWGALRIEMLADAGRRLWDTHTEDEKEEEESDEDS